MKTKLNKRDFAADIAEVLRTSGARKKVKIDNYKMHISDDDGNEASFTVDQKYKTAIYTKEDALNVIEAGLYLVEKYMREGKSLSFQGIGTIYPKKYESYRKSFFDKGEITVPERYLPHFRFGNKLVVAAKLYSEDVRNGVKEEEEPLYSDDDYEFNHDEDVIDDG